MRDSSALAQVGPIQLRQGRTNTTTRPADTLTGPEYDGGSGGCFAVAGDLGYAGASGCYSSHRAQWATEEEQDASLQPFGRHAHCAGGARAGQFACAYRSAALPGGARGAQRLEGSYRLIPNCPGPPGRLGALPVFHSKFGFVWRFCMSAQGA